MRLHVGAGSVSLAGWINIDLQPALGVDRVMDVRDGLPFEDVEFIFAEHFLEHLSFMEAQAFMGECRRVLSPVGVLRISTPNLDWVWATNYSSRWTALSSSEAMIDAKKWAHDETAARDCLQLNRAFHGWGHKFLYNLALVEKSLGRAGFARVERCRYGESIHPELRNVEHHERYDDSPILPHVLVVEASGIAHERTNTTSLDALIAEYVRDLSLHSD